MQGKQQIVAFLGIALVMLAVWQHWKSEFQWILFNPPANKTGTYTGPLGAGVPDPATGKPGPITNPNGLNPYGPGSPPPTGIEAPVWG